MKYVEHLTASVVLQGSHPVFFALYEHLIVPHRFPESERKRRDHILLERNFGATRPQPAT